MEPSVHGSIVHKFFKEFNTEATEDTENTEKRRSAEEVLGWRRDGAGGRLRAWFVTISANEHDRRAFGLFHEETGGGGEFIGNGEDRCPKRPSGTIPPHAAAEEYG